MLKKIALLVTLICTGIAGVQASYEDNTLGANSGVSNSLVENRLGADTAGALLKAPYKGFYQIGSKVINKTVTFPKVMSNRSFPDDRWAAAAKDIASLAEAEVHNTGSRIDTRATAYVAFYDVGVEGVNMSKVRRLETSMEGESNTLAVLVVSHKNHTSAKSAQPGTSGQSSSNVYLFKLTL